MKLFGFELGSKATRHEATEPVQQFAPNTEISYDPKLISRFTAHHRELMVIIGKAREAAMGARYSDLAADLRSFRSLPREHFLEENVRLYSYLSHCLHSDVEGREMIGDMRSEMGDIGRLVMRFLKQHIEIGVTGENADEFIGDLDNIIAALADRTGREERSLYTLYRAPSEFVVAA